MKIGNRLWQLVSTVFALILCTLATGTALAQSYPNKPVRIIVATGPSGGLDFTSRVVAQKLSAAIQQQVVIDNRPGSAGNVGAEVVAKAAPDGYTLLAVAASHATNAGLYPKLGYDPIKDFAPITQLTAGSYLFLVHPSVPVKSVKEFVALAKAEKGKMVYGSAGSGYLGHLGTELFKTIARFDAVHVPYKSGGQAMLALMGGEVPMHIASVPSGLAAVKGGRVRVLAVTNLKRSALLPDVPTVAESGFPGFEINGWYGLLATAGTPREVVTRLHDEVGKILRQSDVRERLMTEGAEPVGSTPEEFAAYIDAETIKWGKVIRQSGAKAD